MRRITSRTAVAFGALLFAVALAGPASAAGATKVPLLKEAFGSCSTGAAGGAPTGGFAIIHSTGSNALTAEVSLKGATPNTTYTLALVQTPSGTDCFDPEATITTNGVGNGNVHIQEPLRAGTTGAFILIQPDSTLGFIASSPLVAVG
jgi:hypothetical protein